jgi:cell division septal protein FtsQ
MRRLLKAALLTFVFLMLCMLLTKCSPKSNVLNSTIRIDISVDGISMTDDSLIQSINSISNRLRAFIDIRSIKESLTALPQVEGVEIRRQFPNQIKIRIRLKNPCARVMINDASVILDTSAEPYTYNNLMTEDLPVFDLISSSEDAEFLHPSEQLKAAYRLCAEIAKRSNPLWSEYRLLNNRIPGELILIDPAENRQLRIGIYRMDHVLEQFENYCASHAPARNAEYDLRFEDYMSISAAREELNG